MSECTCERCPTCNGSGQLWFSGEIVRTERFDDMCEMIFCDDCNGTGFLDICESCVLEREEEEIE